MVRPVKVEVRPPRPGEAAALSALALRSKAHWGYDETFLELCRDELTYTGQQLADGSFGVVDDQDGAPAGFYRLTGRPPVGQLDALFVDPPHIGTGFGGLLLRDALDRAAAQGFSWLELDADPDAAPFYARHGALTVGDSPSGSIPGRVLPRMRFQIPDADSGRRR